MGHKSLEVRFQPTVLEDDLYAGWPVLAIAAGRHLDIEDVQIPWSVGISRLQNSTKFHAVCCLTPDNASAYC